MSELISGKEAFSRWVVTHPDNLKITAHEEGIMFDAWQAAKAKAVPEGFVVINKKDLARVLNCVTDDWLVDTDSFEEFKKIESLVQDEVNAMIEAQEQKG